MKLFIFGILLVFSLVNLQAQNHVSVPVDSPVYNILDQAQLRGLISTLPAVRPYSRAFIIDAIRTILDSPLGILSANERIILQNELDRYSPPSEFGTFDWDRGNISWDNEGFSGDAGLSANMSLSGARYDNLGFSFGLEGIMLAYTRGNIGEQLSYGFNFNAIVVRAPRVRLGDATNYYDGFIPPDPSTSSWTDAIQRDFRMYSEPLTAFPFTFRKNWDGGYFLTMSDLSHTGFTEWPDTLGIGPHIISEISGSHLNDTLTWRFGRTRREWAGMSLGQSLTLNSAAQPFVGIEGSFRPVPWFGFSAMTGVLEYVPTEGDQRRPAWGAQSLFSIEQIELNFNDYFSFGFGTTTIWGKRMELGYIFPLIPNFIYQSYVGDYDNSGLFLNLRGQIPGRGRLWFSLFIDDIVPATLSEGTFWELDWNQYAYQAGLTVPIPWFGSFTNLTFSYTKIEPYTYTHRRIFAPFHNSGFGSNTLPLETAYVNNGVSLGSYLPPNSDEFLLRLETMPTVNTMFNFQFQLIRHGASFGSGAVDGSHLLSELDPRDRLSNPVLRKFFLRDGAYRWLYVFKVGGELTMPRNVFGEHSLMGLLFSNVPARLFFETGYVYSYYTNIGIAPNSGKPSSYSTINTTEYPRSGGFILTLGVRLFPQ